MNAIFIIILIILSDSLAQATKKEELMQKIRKLEISRAKLKAEQKAKRTSLPAEESKVEKIIKRYEKILFECDSTGIKSEKCANAQDILGALYFDRSRDLYVDNREQYILAMEDFENDSSLPVPVEPKEEHSAAISMYKRLITEYPDYVKKAYVYDMLMRIFIRTGDIQNYEMYKQKLIDEFPDYAKWIKIIPPTNEEILSKLESMNRDDYSENQWTGIVYRKGELHYQLGHKRKARQIFIDFVKKCENDEGFKKCGFCDNAKGFLELLKK